MKGFIHFVAIAVSLTCKMSLAAQGFGLQYFGGNAAAFASASSSSSFASSSSRSDGPIAHHNISIFGHSIGGQGNGNYDNVGKISDKTKDRRGNGREKGGKNKTNNKRVSQIKYEGYLMDIFPDVEGEAVGEITDLNGRELARPGEFPHMAAIGYNNTVIKRIEYKCGASLISTIFVVTAAHCTQFNGLSPDYVRFGDLNLRAREPDTDPQMRQVARVINHPSYKDDSLYNDIGLIQLTMPVIFTEFVHPICLWYREEVPFTNAYAMGYGAVQFAGAMTNRLTDFNLTIISNDMCTQLLPKEPSNGRGIVSSQICAIDYKQNGSDTFQGDSGGPLQVSLTRGRRNRLHSYLIGITSYGLVGANRYPGVYTRVSSFVDWIEQNVWSADFYEQ